MRTIHILMPLLLTLHVFAQGVNYKADNMKMEIKLAGFTNKHIQYTALLRYAKNSRTYNSNIYDYKPRTGQSSFSLIHNNFELNRPMAMINNNIKCLVAPKFYIMLDAALGCFINGSKTSRKEDVDPSKTTLAREDRKLIIQSGLSFGYLF